jgi:hypothetical protein
MIPKRQTDGPKKPSAPGDLIGLRGGSNSLRLATLVEGKIDDPHQAIPLTLGKESCRISARRSITASAVA